MTIWLPDGYHIGTAQVPDSIGTVIDTAQDPDGHHIGTGDYQTNG